MTDETHKLELGSRHQLSIAGETVTAGFNVIRDVPQLAYMPTTNNRPEVGTKFTIDDVEYEIVSFKQSDYVPKMVVITLKEVANGDDA